MMEQEPSAWPEIISEVLVNLGSAWLALVIVEPRINRLEVIFWYGKFSFG